MSCLKSSNRLFLLLIPCLMFLLVSCQSGPAEPEGQCTVTFSVSNYRQVSFDDLSSSGMSRAEKIYMTLANLSLTVFDAETNKQVISTILHKSVDYEASSTLAKTYSKFSVSLPYGRYRVLVLGYNGSRACSITSLNHISWEENYVPNTFLYCEEFTLDESTNLNRDITLRHVVSAFCVTAEDAIPANLKKMRFISTAGGTVLDATTGFTPQSTGRTSEIAVPDSHLGKIDTFTVYLFLPEEQITTNYTIQALDKNNAVFCEKHFNDVPLRINYLTEWHGKAFEQGEVETPDAQSSFNISWDINWADTLRLNGE